MAPSTSAHLDGLDEAQLGHLKHIQALAKQLPNDWSGMQQRSTGQEDFGGYRFQIAYASYALALAHRHRLPNAPVVFKDTFDRLIRKILLPQVWLYWRDVSRGGSVFNAHLSDQLQERWDPIAEDNIMYSAYVQSMVAMYNVLFQDDKYAKPEALSLNYWSFFWGGEPKQFSYDQDSLTDLLYWNMVKSGYIGIACEPNCIFQICNQPAIIGFRMHDILTGGSLAEDVVAGYERAWRDYGRLDKNGHYQVMLFQDSKVVRPNEMGSPWVDAWCGTLMNSWNREFVHSNYPSQRDRLITRGDDGEVSVIFPPARQVMGQEVVNDTNDFGWVAAWASEMGDHETLEGLLKHADRYMNPTWHHGALHYPRNDTATDAAGNRTLVEPLTGNTLLAYARLNIPDGLWSLYNEPWDETHFQEPLVVSATSGIDITTAWFDRESRQLHLTAQAAGDGDPSLAISNVPGDFIVTRAEQPLEQDRLAHKDGLLRIHLRPGTLEELTIHTPTWKAS